MPSDANAHEPASDRLTLAGSEVTIPLLGVGTWAWGDRATWGMGGYDAGFTLDSITEAWEASIDAGVTFFDTAEMYGRGESERIIGRLLADCDPSSRDRIAIATKFMPMPWKVRITTELMASLRASLDRLGMPAVDLYQIHGPISLRGHAAMAEALATAHQAGLVRAVGVSNYSARETRAMDEQLRRRGLRLATNQVECSLLRRRPETGGLLATCAELGVVVLAYSPLGQGRLTGKYSAETPPPGRRNFSAYPMDRVEEVVAAARRIGDAHERTPAQVALNWLIAKGTVPIPGAKNRDQAVANAGALGWSLSAEEVAALDAVALDHKGGFQSLFWQHG